MRHYACTPVKLRWDNHSILGVQSVDTATHPDYRRKGVFVKLATNRLEVWNYLYIRGKR